MSHLAVLIRDTGVVRRKVVLVKGLVSLAGRNDSESRGSPYMSIVLRVIACSD